MEPVILRSLLKQYNSNRTLENWVILENLLDDKSYCQYCGGSIFYPNSIMRVSKEGILKYDINFPCSRSFKEIEGIRYHLKACPSCLEKEFPEYSSMNKARVFNVMSKITIYAFQIPIEVAKRFTKTTAVTLKNLIKKYGEEEGAQRWEKYCNLQAVTNSLDYKKEKYGWSENDFKSFNKSRAITLKNMIKKYGETEGTKIFNNYVEKQKINGKSLEWFLNKHGKDEGKKVFRNMLDLKLKGMDNISAYSKPSQDLFDRIDALLGPGFTTFYHKKNNEYEIIIENEKFKIYYLDYYIKELNICIEFFGDYYHANPKKYKNPEQKIKFRSLHKISDIWEKDKNRIDDLKKYLGIKTIIVWESDYNKNKDNEEFYKNIISQCIEK